MLLQNSYSVSLGPNFLQILEFSNISSLPKEVNSLILQKLKHYIRKQTSFNNIWTVLLKSELNGVCSLKAISSASFQNHPLKPSISDKNPNLLEVYSVTDIFFQSVFTFGYMLRLPPVYPIFTLHN